MTGRPPAKRATGRSNDTATRPGVRDLTRGSVSYHVDWDVRTAYDFVFALSGDAGSTDDLPAADREWLRTSRDALDPEARDGVKALFETELAIHTGVLLVDA